MPSVTVKDGEPIEVAIRRFKRAVEKAGIPKELRQREFFQKASLLHRRQKAAACKRLAKKLLRDSQLWLTTSARGTSNHAAGKNTRTQKNRSYGSATQGPRR